MFGEFYQRQNGRIASARAPPPRTSWTTESAGGGAGGVEKRKKKDEEEEEYEWTALLELASQGYALGSKLKRQL